MLQLIGFVLCGAMFAHGVSMFGNANFRAPDAQGEMKMTEAGNMAGGLFIVAAGAFALWFYILGEQIEKRLDRASSIYGSPSMSPLSPGEVDAVAEEAMAAADAADKAAREVIDAAAHKRENY